jgi:flagellar M-ring protein FliF
MSTFWQEVLARPREIYAKLSRGQRLGVLALASVGIVVAILASLLAGRESFALLYSGLEPKDAREVCTKLQEMGVAYRLSPDETAVQVPEQKVAESRMQLSGAGLPKLGARGFDLFDENQFGLTDSLLNITTQRALQGAIEKSIDSMTPVKAANVILTLPERSPFRGDQSRPTAAVKLTLRAGMPLSQSEVFAIAHLVASSVGRGMRLNDVTITDSEPRLLHPQGDENDPMFSAAYLQKVQSLESYLQEKAESQLRAAFGPDKAAVRVNLELDLTHKETAEETVEPEGKVVVKETSSTEGSSSSTTSGDPSLAANAKASKEPAATGPTRTESEKEYREGSKRQLSIAPAGSITHMSVSVLLDDSDAAITAKSADIEKVVKNAVGFSEKRKDSWSLATATFTKPPAPEKAPGPFAIENLLPLLGHVAEGVTVLFVLLFLTRVLRGGASPVRRKGAKGVVAGAVAVSGVGGAGVPDQEEDAFAELQFAEEKGPDLRAKLGRFVNKHPDAAREVLVAWLKEEVTS